MILSEDDIKEYITITEEDDDKMANLKTKLQNLRPFQLRIFLTYVHTGKYSETAKEFGVTSPTIKEYINRIKKELLCI